MSSRSQFAILAAMLVIDSMHLIFGRMLAFLMPPLVSGFYVMLLAIAQLTAYMWWTGKTDMSVFRSHWRFFAIIGFLVASATWFSYLSVSYIDAGTASLLGRMSTVITLALSYFWLRETLTKQELLGAVFCIVGAFVISFRGSDVLQLGTLFVLAAVTFYSLHIAIVKRYGEDMDFLNFFFWRVLMTAFFLTVFVAGTNAWQLPPSPYAWLVLVITALVDVVISRILYYWALRQMRLGIHTIVLTLTPVLTILIALMFFGEQPEVRGLIGGAIVLLGIVIVALAQQRRTIST